jgi:hypothetical protein
MGKATDPTNLKKNSQKIFCDLNRVCEVEDATSEWYDARYYS